MSEIAVRQVMDDDGNPAVECIDKEAELYIPMKRRIMTAEEIQEREQLNRANTAEAVYRRAQELRAQTNGNGWNALHGGERVLTHEEYERLIGENRSSSTR